MSKHAREAEVWKFISSLRFQGIGAGGGEEGEMRLTELCWVFLEMHIVLLKDVILWPKLASPRWSMSLHEKKFTQRIVTETNCCTINN